MADSSEPAFLFLYRKEAVAPVDYLSTFATAPLFYIRVLPACSLLFFGSFIQNNDIPINKPCADSLIRL